MDEQEFQQMLKDYHLDIPGVEIPEGPAVSTAPIHAASPEPEPEQPPEQAIRDAQEAQTFPVFSTRELVRRMRRGESERLLDTAILTCGSLATGTLFVGTYAVSMFENAFIGHGWLESALELVFRRDMYYTPCWWFWALAGLGMSAALMAFYVLIVRRRAYGPNGEYIADLNPNG